MTCGEQQRLEEEETPSYLAHLIWNRTLRRVQWSFEHMQRGRARVQLGQWDELKQISLYTEKFARFFKDHRQIA